LRSIDQKRIVLPSCALLALTSANRRVMNETHGWHSFLTLAACSEEPGWHDTSGQGRNPKLAAADQDACVRSQVKALPKNPTDADQRSVVDRVQACMKRRGWQLSG
jgi:hypothetical protein